MKIPFMKMSGSGNDFIFIDHRKPIIPVDEMRDFVRKVCRRRVSVGADGLIFIEPSERADFKWRFFNSDGSEGEMCGNGGRCAARFALLKKIAGPSLTFETLAGILTAEVNGMRVKLEVTKPFGLKLDEKISVNGKELVFSSINTGVPHVIRFLRRFGRDGYCPSGQGDPVPFPFRTGRNECQLRPCCGPFTPVGPHVRARGRG